MTGVTAYRSADAARDNVLAIARSQLGYTEGSNNDTKFGTWYGWNHVAWCNIFVSWVFNQAGLLSKPYTLKSAYVPGTIDTYRAWGQAHSTPAIGDVICLEENGQAGGHVGIVESVLSSTEVVYLSGNTSDPRGGASRPAGNEQEGWGVFRRVHTIQSLDVFGRPDWAKAVAAVVAAPAHPVTPASPVSIPLAATHPEAPGMLITYEDAVYSWNYGGSLGSILAHTNPDRVRDLEKHGMRHVRPTDPEHHLYAPVIAAILKKKP